MRVRKMSFDSGFILSQGRIALHWGGQGCRLSRLHEVEGEPNTFRGTTYIEHPVANGRYETLEDAEHFAKRYIKALVAA